MNTTKQSSTAKAATTQATPAAPAPAPLPPLARLLGNAGFGQFLQAKLKVSNPSDSFELEADRVADQVLRMPNPELQRSARAAPQIQRLCDSCEEDLPRVAESDAAPTVDKATEQSIASLSSGGIPLPAPVRSYMEPRFQADFGAVRIHTDAHANELAGSLQAKAFTVGHNIVFGAGHYAPESESGKRLLAHELTHVVQQGSAGFRDSKVVQRDFDFSRVQSPLDPLQERRSSLGTGWYIEMDPATPVVKAGTEVAFHLLNSQGFGFSDWEEEIPNAGKRPVFVLTDTANHKEFHQTKNIKPYHAVFKQELNKPGKYRATFFGHPKEETLDGTARNLGQEVRVSVDFDVVADLSFEKLNGSDIESTSARDLEHLESPQASDGERFAAFERLAVRHAFTVLDDNRKEAEEQLELYTKGAAGKTATTALDELKKIVDVDDWLQRGYYRLVHDDHAFLYELKPRAQKLGIDPIALQKQELARIQELRDGLIQAFPALGLVGRRGEQNPNDPRSDNELQFNFRRVPNERANSLTSGLRQVLTDIEKAKRQLATGELSILKAAPILAATRKALGIDADPKLSGAIDRQLKEHGAADSKTDLVIGAAQLLLLFIPGIGPYLAVGLGIVVAARSWKRAAELEAGAGAGVRGGIVDRHDLEAQKFWAILDTAFVALDLGTAAREALSAAKGILPHVPEATARIAERSAETAGEATSRAAHSVEHTAEELLDFAESLSAGGGDHFSITEGDLAELATRLLERQVDLTGKLHVHTTMADFEAAYQKAVALHGGPANRIPGAFTTGTGDIHLRPGHSLVTALHEVIHKVAREKMPWGRRLLGRFLNEGITESIAIARVGPRTVDTYVANVAITHLLESRVGRDVVEGAILDGHYPELWKALTQSFGGDEERTIELFNTLRQINAEAPQADLVKEVRAMLERAESKSAKQAAPTVTPPKSAAPEVTPGGGSHKTQTGGHTPGGGGPGGPGGTPPTPHQGAWSERPERLLESLERDRAANRHVRTIPRKPKLSPAPPNGEFRVGIRRSDIAYDAYNAALDQYVGSEVGVFYDDATGEYRVLVGDGGMVQVPKGDSWRTLLHYHPNEENALRYRLPAPQDIQELMFRTVRNRDQGAVREFVEWDFPLHTSGNDVQVIRRRTEFGIDPSHHGEPFYVRIQLSDGSWEEPLRFASIKDYQKFWFQFPGP